MKRGLKIVSIIISLIFFFVIFQWVYAERNNYKRLLVKSNNEVKQKTLEIEISKNNTKRITKYSGLKLSSIEYLDLNGDKQLLSKYAIKKGPILVFRNSELMCSACIDQELNNLNKFNLLKEYDKCCIITDYSKKRDLNYFMVYNNIDIDLLNIKSLIDLDNEIEGPYYFVLQKDLTIVHLFIPDDDKSNLTKEYLNFVMNKYFSKNTI